MFTLTYTKDTYERRTKYFNKYPNRTDIDFFNDVIREPYKELPTLKIITDNFINYPEDVSVTT